MNKRNTILVVEDEPEVRRLLQAGLASEGFDVVEAGSREEAFARLSQDRINLVTLDLGLGQDDGLELAREIRAIHNIPILIVTGRGEPIDRVRGLEQGADDYVAKPFHIREIVLRIRTLLIRYDDSDEHRLGPPDSYTFDHATLDMRRRELRHNLDGETVELTATEMKLLEIFLRHPARVLSRDELNNYLRGHDWTPLDRTLDGHIARLRRKIEPIADEPRLIKSVRGIGYVFCG